MTADDLLARLRARCAPPAWAFFPEFRSATGAGVRSLDALAVSLFASKGLEVHGYEIKVDRSDLKRELADAEKAEAVGRHCDRFWLVVPAPDLIGLDDEVPAPWGVLVSSGDGLRAHRKAMKLPGLPDGRCREFVTVLARRAAEDVVPKRDVERVIGERVRSGVEAMRRFYDGQKDYRSERAEADAKQLRETLDKFSAACGERLSSWNCEKVGGALRAHLEGSDAEARLGAYAERAIRDLDAAREALARLLPESRGESLQSGSTNAPLPSILQSSDPAAPEVGVGS